MVSINKPVYKIKRIITCHDGDFGVDFFVSKRQNMKVRDCLKIAILDYFNGYIYFKVMLWRYSLGNAGLTTFLLPLNV